MSKEISKSPEMLQKEATIQSLQKDIKKTRSTLKSLKTRLANTQQQITDIQLKVTGQYFRLMEDMDNIKQEIVATLKRLMKMKNLVKEEKQQMKMMADQMEEESFGEEYEEYRRQKAKMENGEFDFEENHRAKMRDMFAEFRVKPNEKEQRDIRKVFIKLSTHFHPDKAKNKTEEEFFHGLMQEINEAYQQGDIDRLLEIERMNLEMESLDFQSKSVTVDMLQQAINRLTKELEYLKSQVKRTSTEIKQLRKSDLGKILTDLNKAEREGEGMDEMIEEMEDSKNKLSTLRDNLKKAEEKGDLSEFYQEMLGEMEDNPFDNFEMEGEGMEDFMATMEMFSEMMEEDDYEVIENPKFEIDSSVRIKDDVFSEFSPKTNMKGWVGQVSDAFISDGKEWYNVDFDSITIKSIPPALILQAMKEGEDFSAYDFSPNNLESVSSRDTTEEMMRAYRTTDHQYRWKHWTEEEQKLMLEIMMQLPDKIDQENWAHYLKNNLTFPFKAKARGLFHLKPESTHTIKEIYEWDNFAGGGQLINIRKGFQNEPHPLADFKTTGENQLLLDVYFRWFTEVSY